MLKKQTVFVVGAGASAAYNFPTGKTLFRDARSNSVDSWLHQTQSLLGKAEAQQFMEILRDSQEESLDSLLEFVPSALKTAGKIFIADKLLESENSSVGDMITSGDWFRYLFSRLAEGISTGYEFFQKNRFHFVTFNYDRLIEHRLFRAICVKYLMSEQERSAFGKAVAERVIHLHGSVGSYFPGTTHIPFGGPSERRSVIQNGDRRSEVQRIFDESIYIIHQARPESAEFAEARRVLGLADQVIFLGFSFGAPNVSRLGIQTIPQGASIYGTRLGMTNQEWARYAQNPFANASRTLAPANIDWDCERLLREYVLNIFD
jgi:hypothetical protein